MEALKIEEPLEIEIPITEFDLEDFKFMLENNETINGTFNDIKTGKAISVSFMTEDELEQRDQ